MRKRTSFILIALLLLEMLTLGILYYYIPHIRRPFELIMGIAAGFGIIDLFVVRNNIGRYIILFVASVAGSFFALEMAQKYFDILSLIRTGQDYALVADKGELSWSTSDEQSYLDARRRARERGWDLDAVKTRFAGDIFAGRDKSTLVTNSSNTMNREMADVSLKPFRTFGPPLGFELTPDNVARTYFIEKSSGQTLFDAEITSGPAGERKTGGKPDSDSTYVFFGCSVTFGYGLCDDQTLPHFFSEAGGFAHNVVNLAFNGNGPHNALRDLELDYHLGGMGVDPGTVKGVVFGLIGDHSRRVLSSHALAPWYELDAGGGPEYRGTLEDKVNRSPSARLSLMMEKSRIYPVLKTRIVGDSSADADSEGWRLTFALLREMDRICRGRYGVGLTVLYWEEDRRVIERLQGDGLRVLKVSDALGKDWGSRAIQYLLHDNHPNAYANKKLGYFLHGAMTRER